MMHSGGEYGQGRLQLDGSPFPCLSFLRFVFLVFHLHSELSCCCSEEVMSRA